MVLLGAMTLGCHKEQPAADNPVKMTTTLTLGTDGAKALGPDGTKSFAPGDQIAVVYKNTSGKTAMAVSDALPDGEYGKRAQFTVALLNPASGGAVRYIYPAAMAKESIGPDDSIDDEGTIDYSRLSLQDGTLGSLAAGLDLCVFDGNLSGGLLPVSASMANRLVIGQFTVKNALGTDVSASITSLTVSDGVNGYVVNRAAAAGPIYVAMLPVSSDKTISLSASDGTDGYVKTVSGQTLESSHMYPVSVTMVPCSLMQVTPFTMEAKSDGTIQINNPRPGMQYTLNGGPKTPVTENAIEVSTGDKVAFYGDGTKILGYGAETAAASTRVSYGTAEYYAYGNIMSLVDEHGFANNRTLVSDYAFAHLFRYKSNWNTRLYNHAGKELVLPATTLTSYCYYNMFDRCAYLTSSPALPAMQMASYCYANMFYNCQSLDSAPELPAMTLADHCYNTMFQGCVALTKAPDLPAPTLVDACYSWMFYGCTKLSQVKCLAVNPDGNSYTVTWLQGVAATGTFVKKAGVSWGESGTSSIPAGWTVTEE